MHEDHKGYRYGELLLKAVLRWAQDRPIDWIFVEVFDRHEGTIALLQEFGFEVSPERTLRGERVLAKPLRPSASARHPTDPLSFHVRFGPRYFRVDGIDALVVPIEPRFHGLLFPEAEDQESLLAGRYPFGNRIRKAYLCHSNLRGIIPGSVLLFYRSGAGAGIRCVGIAERASRLGDAESIAQTVSDRTVYPMAEIVKWAVRPTLVVLFRHAVVLDERLSLALLREKGVLAAAPQAITRVKSEGRPWLNGRLQASS